MACSFVVNLEGKKRPLFQ